MSPSPLNRKSRDHVAPRADTLGLYIHWPFCKAKCPYCDFNSHVRSHVDQDRWRRALLQELRDGAERLGHGRTLTSIFFGGGTPSLMPPATVAALIEEATKLFRTLDGIEITLEANPTSTEAVQFAGFAQAGVNRLSLGVQSLDDKALRFLGREHSAQEAIQAIEIAKAQFGRTSFDLIYARAGQTIEGWQAELAKALQWADGHISLYQLTIEPGTRFHAEFQAGRLPVMADDEQAQLFELTVETLQDAGFDWYEISNFAKPGQQSQHNLVYWRYGDYLGIGPGAHSRLTLSEGRLGTATIRAPDRWLAAVEAVGHGLDQQTPITPHEAALEALMMGLRLESGIELAQLETITGQSWQTALDQAALEQAQQSGWLALEHDRLRATAHGRLVLDGLLAQITKVEAFN